MFAEMNSPKSQLESDDHVAVASKAIQQLPRILHAMRNMARRTRRQLHKKCFLLGDDHLPMRKGILKNVNHLGLDRISAFYEFWKTFSFSFISPNKFRDIHDIFTEIPGYGCIPGSQLRLTPPQRLYFKESFRTSLCQDNVQSGTYRAQTILFLESMSVRLSSLESLKRVLFKYLNKIELSIEEQEILLQLQYLKILFNTPIHKLVRERPKEYLIPLPRRRRRKSGRQPYPSILATHQTIMFPGKENMPSWFSWSQLSPAQKSWLHARKIFTDEDIAYFNSISMKTVPRGVSFITYPDSVDETSFEGTIGGRSVISWVEGTKFPQMGIDQTSAFKLKKERGRLRMIERRMQAARAHRRNSENSTCSNPKKNKRAPRRLPETSNQSLFHCLFNLAQLKQSLKAVRGLHTAGPTTKMNEGTLMSISYQSKALKRQERNRRWKIYMISIFKFLSCGLLTYFMKGECRARKRKSLRTVDSRERCRTPELPLPSPALVTSLSIQ